MIGDTPPRPSLTQLDGLDAYQRWTDTTWKHPTGSTAARVHAALAFPEEAGESAGVVKRAIRGDPEFIPEHVSHADPTLPAFHSGAALSGRLDMLAKTPALRERLVKELGDGLYQLARLARDFGIDLSEVAQMNVLKLQQRLADGTITGSGSSR